MVLAPVALARLSYSASRRVRPERPVIRFSIVVASESETSGKNQDQHRGRKRKPAWPPIRSGRRDPGVVALGIVNEGSAERGQVRRHGRVVGSEEVRAILADLEVARDEKDDDVCVNQERQQAQKRGQRTCPPEVRSLCRSE